MKPTQQQTDNALIAEFMGWKYCENDLIFSSKGTANIPAGASVFSGWVKQETPYIKGVPLIVVKENRKQIEYLRKNLKYHESWDWLIPAIHKALEICHNEMLNEWENGFANAFLSCGIELPYRELTEFIKWYNQQPTP